MKKAAKKSKGKKKLTFEESVIERLQVLDNGMTDVLKGKHLKSMEEEIDALRSDIDWVMDSLRLLAGQLKIELPEHEAR